MSQTFHVTGNKLVATGECLSRTDEGEIVFVRGLIPGEVATVEETYKKGKISFADVVSIEEPSENRVTEPCPYVAHGCGGCDWQHISIGAQSQYKTDIVVDALTRVGKIQEATAYLKDTIVLSKERYRTSARILATNHQWGFHQYHSDEMVAIKDCLVMHPECVRQATDVMESIETSEVHEAQIRRHPDAFQEVSLSVSTLSFFQSHIDAPDTLADIITEYVGECGTNLTCVDLFSGVGVIALALAHAGHGVTAVEGNPHAVGDARKNFYDTTAEIVHCDVRKFRYEKKNPCDVVIADPSREGLGKEMMPAVLSCDADAVVLVSCDPASGARDLATLIENGYELKSITPIDMFGHTHHVEMVSFLQRS